jgi:hypothetical protein
MRYFREAPSSFRHSDDRKNPCSVFQLSGFFVPQDDETGNVGETFS